MPPSPNGFSYLEAAVNQRLVQVYHHALLVHVLVAHRGQQVRAAAAGVVLVAVDALLRRRLLGAAPPQATKQRAQEAAAALLVRGRLLL